ncbi:restriction endonuclease [Limosilactobacillus caccae]|uniref:restriction endonuclease n=1 Tax=Limosilactobacillus caccae TaxID=1926284 RepID=UPI000970EC6F|nr:restriction endonuclease [Limosilactobacillus caccae]
MNKSFYDLKRKDQEAYLMLPIIRELKRLGGQASTKEVRRSVVTNDEYIPEDALTKTTTSRNGNVYHPFEFPFNFAVTNLIMAGYLERPKTGLILLTEKGRAFQGNQDELTTNVYKLSLPMWNERLKKNVHQHDIAISDEDANTSKSEEWRSELLDALIALKPSKFELFCRALVKKMNVDIDETIGVKLSGDGGIDGYGYMTTDDFRTTRVAIQAKRWKSDSLVSSPEIDKFRGAMDKYRAEYGIFITTSSFTRDAIRAARLGTRVVTLIDGDHLVDLVAKYQLYVTPVITYELGDFFTNDD